MGVLECNRYGCENIMCDRLSYEYGYICYECFEELVLSGPNTNIEEFMGIERQPNYEIDYEEVRAKYEEIFPDIFQERED